MEVENVANRVADRTNFSDVTLVSGDTQVLLTAIGDTYMEIMLQVVQSVSPTNFSSEAGNLSTSSDDMEVDKVANMAGQCTVDIEGVRASQNDMDKNGRQWMR